MSHLRLQKNRELLAGTMAIGIDLAKANARQPLSISRENSDGSDRQESCHQQGRDA